MSEVLKCVLLCHLMFHGLFKVHAALADGFWFWEFLIV
jgi:hypothetical protein